MKGIILAGGTGSRLWPATAVVSKQLLPVFDKPMIYYPLSTLMLAGVRDVQIITTPESLNGFIALLGNGQRFGIKISYTTQIKPEGIAQAVMMSEDFLLGEPFFLVLGDNIFHGAGMGTALTSLKEEEGARIFVTEVSDPQSFGVLKIDNSGKPLKLIEKPRDFVSNFAVTGLYKLDGNAIQMAKQLKKSDRGEYEITDLLQNYLDIGLLKVTYLSRGIAWLDTGTASSLADASLFIRVVEERTGLKIGCLEEIALNNGWISSGDLQNLIRDLGKSSYSDYLRSISNVSPMEN
jgi:glucose-1-phosphate thymidylyltransferase